MYLKEEYKDVCKEYIRQFSNNHNLDLTEFDLDNCWVDSYGGIAEINDCFFNFDDIRYDVDHNYKDDKIFDWYWKNLEREELNIPYMNYSQYCAKQSNSISVKDWEKIKRLNEEVRTFEEELLVAKEKLNAIIQKYKK